VRIFIALACNTVVMMKYMNKSKEELIKEFETLQQQHDSLKSLLDIELTKRKQSEKLLQEIIDKNPMPIQILDMEGYTIQVNPAHTMLFGVMPPPEYSIFKDFQLVKHGFGKLFEKIKSGEVVHFPGVYYNAHDVNPACPDVSLWLKATAFTLNDNTGKPKKIVLTHEDATERKQAREALLRSEKKYKAVTEQLPLCVFEANLEGKFTFVNTTALTTFGYNNADFQKGLTIYQMIAPDERVLARLNFQNILKGAVDTPHEYLTIRKDGSLFPSLIHTRYIIEDGNPVGISGFVFDISDRKQAEMKLRENEQMLQTVLDNFPGVVFWKDTQSNYLGCNHANAVGAGFNNSSEMIGKNDFDMPWATTDAENYRADDQEVIKSGKAKMHIVEMIHQVNNQVKWLDTSKIPLRNAKGQIIGILGASADITERKKNEKELIEAKERAEESDRLKTAFLQNMSHEIRTPMNAIMGFSSLLVENYDNKPNLEKFSEIISQRCSDLLEIINDILDISKIESGQFAVHVEACDINELFAELKSFFTEQQNRIGKQHIKFSLQFIGNKSGVLVQTDKVKLKQILINLIGNAFKFTEKGSIECGCQIDNNQLLFYVSDTGIGIPTDKYELIFERFSQLHHPAVKNIGGTGLGLSIAKGLANLLGGKIWLQSEPDKGTTFNFSIPYNKSGSLPKEYKAGNEDQPFIFSNKTILIVEDDYYNALYLKEILGHTGFNIVSTIYGKEAVQIATSQPVDLVLMDIRLPDMNGYEATCLIRKLKPHMKIIAQTTYAAHDERQKAIDAGCIDYVSKPTKQELLLALIRKHLAVTK
jgi:PAS domain S-box-containing protein